MHATSRKAMILAGLVIGVSACGSEPADDLAGEWVGKCTTTQIKNGDQTTSDVDATLEFGPDGKYIQKISGPRGFEVEGTFTATDETINLVGKNGQSVSTDYTLNDDVLTITTPDPSATGGVTSTCNLSRS